MCITGVSIAMDRIKSAEPHSQIGVFKAPDAGMIETVFAATVNFPQRKKSDSDYIGVFDNTMDSYLVRKILKAEAG